MWFEVTIFHAERHTLLTQSLTGNILRIQLFSCGSSSLVWLDLSLVYSQPVFPVDRVVCRKKGAGYARLTRPLFRAEHYHFKYKLKAIMPCGTEERAEEWSGHVRLQSVLHGFLLFWVLVISRLAATMARWWQWKKQWSSCSWVANLAFYCKVLVQQHTKLPHVWNSQFDCINKPLVPAKILRK